MSDKDRIEDKVKALCHCCSSRCDGDNEAATIEILELIKQAKVAELEYLRKYAGTHTSVDTTARAWERLEELKND
jgi:hypothetical protein